jgi:hypothetical protein
MVVAMKHKCEPVGMLEIAEMLGVDSATVSQWWYRTRKGMLPVPMPEPRWLVSGGPAWDGGDIREWDAERRKQAFKRRPKE